jgi:hypothetical protein
MRLVPILRPLPSASTWSIAKSRPSRGGSTAWSNNLPDRRPSRGNMPSSGTRQSCAPCRGRKDCPRHAAPEGSSSHPGARLPRLAHFDRRGAGDEAELQILPCGDTPGKLRPPANCRLSLGARRYPARRPQSQPLRSPQNRCRSPVGHRVRHAHQSNHVRSPKTAHRSHKISLIIGGESLRVRHRSLVGGCVRGLRPGSST